jgi:hypothetical protein
MPHLETLEHVLLPRHQLAFAALDVREGRNPSCFSPKNPVGMVEGRGYARRIDGWMRGRFTLSNIPDVMSCGKPDSPPAQVVTLKGFYVGASAAP